MPRRRKRARFEQLTEFERGRIIGLREAGLSYRAVASRVQRNSSTVMRVWKQWTDECRTTRKSGSGPRNVTSARDDRHLVRMARTDRTASSRQLAALWSIATGVSLCASSIRRRLLQCGLRARTPLYRIPLTHDHRRLRLQWANQHRDWRADWQHVVFSDESRFNLWYHDGRIRVRRYAGERHLPECIIERHSGRTPGVMVWGAIAYHRRSQLLRIVGNLNSNRYIREVLQPEAVPFLQSLPGAVFQQDNARPHTARIVKSFFAAQQVQLLPWPACSPDMSPIEHVWDVIGRRLARDPRPVASADELWITIAESVVRYDLLVDKAWSLQRNVGGRSLNIFTFVNIVCACGSFQIISFSNLNVCTFLNIVCLLIAFFSLLFLATIAYYYSPRRMAFATDMLRRIEDDAEFLKRIMFSDEASFHLSGIVNRHSVRIWRSENPHEYREVQSDSPKVNVWCGQMHDRVIGPFFFTEKTVSSVVYLDMLENFVFPQLEELHPHVVLQQDGAPPHWGTIVRSFMNDHFTGR
ncbi:Transposable element Tc1 transposase, partial [Stegodyphus mimosarum]